jgi:Rho-binding antiterminator
MTDYQPISCQQYDHYEIAILRGVKMRISWRDADRSAHLATLLPRDLKTLDGEEFLIARTDTGESIELRLDRILNAEAVT